MKKRTNRLVLSILVLCFTFVSCATIGDIERKRDAGEDTIVERYSHNWEKVFDAITYVLRHSENTLISLTYTNCKIDFIKEEKCIILRGSGTIGIGIYFVPESINKTKVLFVKGELLGAGFRETRIKTLIKESKHLLNNG